MKRNACRMPFVRLAQTVYNIIICDWKNGTGCGRTFDRC